MFLISDLKLNSSFSKPSNKSRRKYGKRLNLKSEAVKLEKPSLNRNKTMPTKLRVVKKLI